MKQATGRKPLSVEVGQFSAFLKKDNQTGPKVGSPRELLAFDLQNSGQKLGDVLREVQAAESSSAEERCESEEDKDRIDRGSGLKGYEALMESTPDTKLATEEEAGAFQLSVEKALLFHSSEKGEMKNEQIRFLELLGLEKPEKKAESNPHSERPTTISSPGQMPEEQEESKGQEEDKSKWLEARLSLVRDGISEIFSNADSMRSIKLQQLINKSRLHKSIGPSDQAFAEYHKIIKQEQELEFPHISQEFLELAAQSLLKGTKSEDDTIPDQLSSSVGSPGRRTPMQTPYEVLEAHSKSACLPQVVEVGSNNYLMNFPATELFAQKQERKDTETSGIQPHFSSPELAKFVELGEAGDPHRTPSTPPGGTSQTKALHQLSQIQEEPSRLVNQFSMTLNGSLDDTKQEFQKDNIGQAIQSASIAFNPLAVSQDTILVAPQAPRLRSYTQDQEMVNYKVPTHLDFMDTKRTIESQQPVMSESPEFNGRMHPPGCQLDEFKPIQQESKRLIPFRKKELLDSSIIVPLYTESQAPDSMADHGQERREPMQSAAAGQRNYNFFALNVLNSFLDGVDQRSKKFGLWEGPIEAVFRSQRVQQIDITMGAEQSTDFRFTLQTEKDSRKTLEFYKKVSSGLESMRDHPFYQNSESEPSILIPEEEESMHLETYGEVGEVTEVSQAYEESEFQDCVPDEDHEELVNEQDQEQEEVQNQLHMSRGSTLFNQSHILTRGSGTVVSQSSAFDFLPGAGGSKDSAAGGGAHIRVEMNQAFQQQLLDSIGRKKRKVNCSPKLTPGQREARDQPAAAGFPMEGLRDWLSELELQQYLTQLIEGGFDDIQSLIQQMRSSLPISHNMLERIGISKYGHRARILTKLELQAGLQPAVANQASQEEVQAILAKKEKGMIGFCDAGSFCTKPQKGQAIYFYVPTLKQYLSSVGLSDLQEKFIDAGYENYEFCLIQMQSSTPITEKVLKEEVGVQKLGYRTRLLYKMQEDALLLKMSQSPPQQEKRRSISGVKRAQILEIRTDDKEESCRCAVF